MTSTGIVFLPLELLAILLPWRWVLPVLAVTTLFSAAAVVAIGSFGLQPGYAMAILIIARFLAEASFGHQSFPRELLPATLPLLAFVLIAVLSLWIAIVFFQGKVLVLGGTDYFQLTAAAPYSFRRENVTQLAYLFIDVALTLGLALVTCRMAPNELARVIDRAIVSAIIVATFLCLWQWTSFNTGIWWPKTFFISNPGYADAGGQEMLGGLRVNGPFSEPSSLASYYAGFLLYSWRRRVVAQSAFSMLLVLSCVGIILLSKSTTGLVVLGMFVLVSLSRSLGLMMLGRLHAPRLSRTGILAAASLVLALMVGALYVVNNAEYVAALFDELVFNKTQGSSFEQRQGANIMALDIVVETWGIGIGLGSHKPSSLLLTLLSNTGILGAAAFVVFFLALVLPSRSERSLRTPARWFVIGLVSANIFSDPNLGVVVMWMGFGLALGSLGAGHVAARGQETDRGVSRVRGDWPPAKPWVAPASSPLSAFCEMDHKQVPDRRAP